MAAITHKDGHTYLDCSEAARRVGVTPACVLNWVKKGLMPSFRFPASRRRWLRECDVEAMTEMQEVPIQETQFREMTPRQITAAARLAHKRVQERLTRMGLHP